MLDFDARGRMTVVGHDFSDVDSVASCLLLKKYLEYFEVKVTVAMFTEPMSKTLEMLSAVGVPFSVEVTSPKGDEQLFLVDHHETPYDLKVVGCIDHHPTEAKYDYPVYINQKASSTAFMILEMMEADGVPLEPCDYAMAVLSVYCDTQSLKSTKLVKDDVPRIQELIAKYNLDEKYLYEAGLGLNDLYQPIEILALNGLKTFDFPKGTVMSSYLQSDRYEDGFVSALIKEVKAQLVKSNAKMWVLLLHDPVHGNTVEYDIADKVTAIDHGALVSRGSNIMPRIEKLFT